ncbi:hypothetical protein ISS37_07150 [candidate division KSB1 bacterium]|nr:hypothetical protein [candidate division KSB1 bacterium]
MNCVSSIKSKGETGEKRSRGAMVQRGWGDKIRLQFLFVKLECNGSAVASAKVGIFHSTV